jgi:glycosyltransferase involved in cell wall biosynthesis
VTSRRLQVTYLSPFVPFAGIPHAGGQFLHHALSRLSESIDITVIAPASDVNQAAAAEPDVTPVRLHLVPIRPRPRTKVGFVPRLLVNTAAGVTPGWQVLRGFRRDPEVWSLVAASDLVELEWAWYLAFAPDVRRAAPRVPITAFEHDVLTESLFRRARRGDTVERTLGWIRALRARSLEPRLLNQCGAVFVFSDRDRSTLIGMGVTSPVVVVDPFVERYRAKSRNEGPPIVLFVGAMDRPENHQGALWFIEEVWPAVEAACPEARLVIAGASPPAALTERSNDTIQITGYVDDLDAIYAEATAFVAPNLTGAGVKFKVLAAMSHGLPVVATPIAAEGIAEHAPPGVFAAVTSDASTMREALVQVVGDRRLNEAIGNAARQWVQNRYDFDQSVATMTETYHCLVGA